MRLGISPGVGIGIRVGIAAAATTTTVTVIGTGGGLAVRNLAGVGIDSRAWRTGRVAATLKGLYRIRRARSGRVPSQAVLGRLSRRTLTGNITVGNRGFVEAPRGVARILVEKSVRKSSVASVRVRRRGSTSVQAAPRGRRKLMLIAEGS